MKWIVGLLLVTGCSSRPSLDEFGRLIGGEWRMRGATQQDTWEWGPGQHSIRGVTMGRNGADPWAALHLFYVEGEEVRYLNLHPDIPGLGRGMSEGTAEFEGDLLTGSFDLFQPGHPGRNVRTMALHWEFSGDDHYHETLLEKAPGREMGTLAEWDMDRFDERAPRARVNLVEFPQPSEQLAPVSPPVMEGDGGVRVRWFLYLDVTVVETSDVAVYFYYHPVAKELRWLLLDESGDVKRGVAEVTATGVKLGGVEWGRKISPSDLDLIR